MGQLAAQAYMQGGGSLGGLETFLSSKGPQEVIDRASGMAVVSDLRTQVLQEASATSVVAGVLQRQAARAQAQQLAAAQAAESARAEAQAMADAAQAQTAAIQRQQAPARGPARHAAAHLRGPRGPAPGRAEGRGRGPRGRRGQGGSRAPGAGGGPPGRRPAGGGAPGGGSRARQEAARQAAAARRSAGRTRPLPRPGAVAPAGPRAGRPAAAATAVGSARSSRYAQAQIGEPYLWGAEGPGSLGLLRPDDEGVAAGRRLPLALHRVPVGRDPALPIWRASPATSSSTAARAPASHHVGLYVGGDQMIEAPHTGANVRVRLHLAAGPRHGGRPALRPPPARERAPPRLRWRPSRIRGG